MQHNATYVLPIATQHNVHAVCIQHRLNLPWWPMTRTWSGLGGGSAALESRHSRSGGLACAQICVHTVSRAIVVDMRPYSQQSYNRVRGNVATLWHELQADRSPGHADCATECATGLAQRLPTDWHIRYGILVMATGLAQRLPTDCSLAVHYTYPTGHRLCYEFILTVHELHDELRRPTARPIAN